MAQSLREIIAAMGRPSFNLLRIAPVLTVGIFLAPVVAGLMATILPALGYHPGLDRFEIGLKSLSDFLSVPGAGQSLLLTVRTGFLAALLAFGLAVLFCASFSHTRWFRWVQSLLAPVMATPHSAIAIGLVFLLAPSGWLIRLASGLLGIARPPNIVTVQDEWGLSFVLAILLKTVPYLTLMTAAALGQVQPGRSLAISRGMGYGIIKAWFKTVFPRIYPQIRLPIYAVLAFSLSVVDLALIMAPNNPPPLSVFILRLFNDKDLAMQLPGAAGALILFLIVLASIGLWRVGGILVARIDRRIYASSRRGGHGLIGRALGAGTMMLLLLLSFLALLVLAIWSLAGRWRFPAALPQVFSLSTWQRHLKAVGRPAFVTVVTGIAAVLLSLILAVLCLENEDRRVSSVYAFLQAAVPLAVYLFAILSPTWIHRNRAGMR